MMKSEKGTIWNGRCRNNVHAMPYDLAAKTLFFLHGPCPVLFEVKDSFVMFCNICLKMTDESNNRKVQLPSIVVKRKGS